MAKTMERETTKAPAKSSRKAGPAGRARSGGRAQGQANRGNSSKTEAAKPSASNAGKTRGRPFQPGNPGGGRPKLPEELKQAFRALAPEALKTLESVMRSSKARPGDRIRAAETILNRGYGTPVQAVEVTGRDGGPIESMTHEQALARLAELRKADGDA